MCAWQEWQLFRVWDSLVLEDEESKLREWGLRHEGNIDDSEAGRSLLHLGSVSLLDCSTYIPFKYPKDM